MARVIQSAKLFLRRHETTLWWLHSAYALLVGLLAMWLGARDFAWLRLVVLYIAFIWVTSLFLPSIARHPRLSAIWRERVRLAVNYFHKNFYQQLLFFVLPLYYASTTFPSRNTLFLVLLALSAVLSTLDIVYDRYLSVRRPFMALFFAFNLFACINVMLPVLWSVSNYRALGASGILATAGFASVLYRGTERGARARMLVLGAAALLLLVIVVFRSFIPPAPLRLARVEFGSAVRNLRIAAPMACLPQSFSGKLAGLTSVVAPMGLREEVRHLWYLDGRLLYASPHYSMTGGRKEGYRIWTQITWTPDLRGRIVTLDVETRAGQLIGRATLAPCPPELGSQYHGTALGAHALRKASPPRTAAHASGSRRRLLYWGLPTAVSQRPQSPPNGRKPRCIGLVAGGTSAS